MSNWVNVTSAFSEDRRHFKHTYLEICELLDKTIECSLFSSPDGPWEIYVNFGMMYGVSCAEADQAEARRKQMMAEIEEEHLKNGDPSPEFINDFVRKYELSIDNALFDGDDLMDQLLDMFK